MPVNQQKNGTWKVSIRRKGYKAVYATFDTYDEAVEYDEDITRQMKRGKRITEHKSESVTLKAALLRYLDEVSITKDGHKQEKNRILALCKLPLAEWYLAEISSMQIAEYRDARLDEGKSPSTIKNNLSILSQVFREAKNEWGMPELVNPVVGVRKPRDRPGRERRLEGNEEELLLKHIDPRYRNALIFAIETAARREEVCNLRREDIDLKAGTAFIRKAKGRKRRIVPLSERARKAILNEPGYINGSLFNIVKDTFTHKFMDACAAGDIQDLKLHDMRHEATSRFVEGRHGDFRDSEIMKITGHTSLKSYLVYVQINAAKVAKRMR